MMLHNRKNNVCEGLKIILSVLLLAAILTMGACGNNNDVDDTNLTEETSGEQQQESTDGSEEKKPDESKTDLPSETIPDSEPVEPMLIVKGTTAKIGAKAIEVLVEIKNNPGILGIDFDVHYDESALKLVDAQSTLDVDGCNYTPPAYYRNPTTFLWDFQDANWNDDRVILHLYFDILDTAVVGECEIKLMYSYGNIFDADGIPIDIKVENACVRVEE